MKYPILISEGGAVVEELDRKKKTSSTTNYSTKGQANYMPSVEVCKQAAILAEHSGFIEGAMVKIKNQPSEEPRRILRLKDVRSEQVFWYYQRKADEPAAVAIILLENKFSPAYPQPFAMDELELA